MNPLSRLGRIIISVRLAANAIDLGVFGAVLAVITFLLLWLLIGSVYLPTRYDLKAGDVAEDQVRAPRTLTFENRPETERRREQAADSAARVFTFDPAVLPRVLKNVGGYFDNVERIISGETAAAQAASLAYDPETAVRRIEGLQGQPVVSETSLLTLAGAGTSRVAEIRKYVHDSTQRILEGNVNEASLAADRDRLKSLVQTTPLSPAEQNAASEVAGAFLEPNNVYNSEKTQQAREQAAAEVQAAMVTVRSGETIVSPGQVVTSDNVVALEALGLTEPGRKYGAIAGIGLVLIIEVMSLALFVKKFERRVGQSRSLQFIVASLFILFTGIDRIAAIAPLSPLIVPMPALGMLGTLMLGSRLSVILVILSSINLALVGGSDPQYVAVGLLGGFAGAFLVTNVSQRRDLLRAGLIASLAVIVTAAGAGQVSESSWSRLGAAIAWGMGNGALSIVAMVGLITVYEMVFNLPTPLKLLELSDPTRPLLKELMMKAPGTYNHSILMGNIAETAAEAIGANPLMARAGAYYHDIGKLNRPDYFIENQFHIKNPHDRLTPSLSRLAITAHVRDGVRLARQEGLPPDIVDIIEEHHGTTVLSYFYHKAKQTAAGGKVNEEAYRYAGRKPTSRESAIIMLADSVEAAVRSLENPTLRNIKTAIRDIFSQRLRDGQLSESHMVFGDLEKVRLVFEKCLRGFGATRIRYPENEKEAAPGAAQTGPRP